MNCTLNTSIWVMIFYNIFKQGNRFYWDICNILKDIIKILSYFQLFVYKWF